MINKEFVLAGKAIFTLEVFHEWAAENNSKKHYTYKTVLKNDVYFVNLLSGPDNCNDYSYIGMLNKESGKVVLTRASKITEECMSYRLLNRLLANIWAGTEQKILDAGFDVHHEGRCGKCNRRLTTPESCRLGIGPECRKEM